MPGTFRSGITDKAANSESGQWERRELYHVDPPCHQVYNSPLNLRELTLDWLAEIDPDARRIKDNS